MRAMPAGRSIVAAVPTAPRSATRLSLLGAAVAQTPAAERGKFWEGTVARDPALAPLRRQAGYLRLAQEATRRR